MALEFRSNFVQAPSASPLVSSGSGGYLFAHRRVNLSGRHSKASSPTVASAFPVTLTPQSYTDVTKLLQDEFLVSADGGVTWRSIPRSGVLTGAQTVSAYSGSWPLTTLTDNQDQTPSTIDLGLYDTDGTDLQTIYVVNTGNSADLLTANIINPDNNTVYTDLSGLVEITLTGVFTETGAGVVSTSFNRTVIWSTDSESANTFPLTLPGNGCAVFQIRLINYPLGGLSGTAVDFNIEFTTNQRTFPIVFDRGWLQGSLVYSPQDGFNFPIIEYGGVSGTIKVNPLAFNYAGTSVVNPRTLTFTPTVSTSKLIVYRTGELDVIPQATTTPSNAIELASFTISGTTLSNLVYKVNFRSLYQRRRTVTTGSVGDFVRVNSSGNLVVSTDTQTPMAVLLTNTGDYGSEGVFIVNAGGAIAAGSKVTSNASGKAVETTGESPWVAVTSATGAGVQLLVENVNARSTAGTITVTTADISDFAEGVDDRVNTLLVAGSGVTKTYNDGANTLTLALDTAVANELVDDRIATTISPADFLYKSYDDASNTLTLGVNYSTFNSNVEATVTSLIVAGTGITKTVASGALTLSLNSSVLNESIDDRIATTIVPGTGISTAYDDAANTLTINYTGSASGISDFNESVDDRVASLLVAGTNITLNYNDAANTLTINSTASGGLDAEAVDDRVDALLVAGQGITKTYNDAANTLTLAVSEAGIAEFIDDRVNALVLTSGFISKTYNDASNTLTIGVTQATFEEAVDDRVDALLQPDATITKTYTDISNVLNLGVKIPLRAGMIMMWPTSTSPTGWLVCDGTAIGRSAYSALFNVIGTTFGAGDGSTTFNLPDLRNRVVAGVGTDGALASTAGSTTKSVPVPQHNHTFTTDNSGAHGHDIANRTNATAFGANFLGRTSATGTVATEAGLIGSTNSAHTHTGTTDNTGTAGATIDVRQSTLYLNFIICTGT